MGDTFFRRERIISLAAMVAYAAFTSVWTDHDLGMSPIRIVCGIGAVMSMIVVIQYIGRARW